LALPGLIPSLGLDRGADWQTATAAHEIYVFERLPHHLILGGIQPEYVVRLGLLWAFWLVLGWWERRAGLHGDRQYEVGDRQECVSSLSDRQECLSSLRAFVAAAVIITLAGAAINAMAFVDRGLAANLLRYYWFRLTDVALPLGVALESVAMLAWWCRRSACMSVGQVSNLSYGGPHPSPLPAGEGTRGRIAARCGLGLVIAVAAFQLGHMTVDRLFPSPPRSHKMADFEAWHAACAWVGDPMNIPPGARFITPRLAQTFGWYSGHSEVVSWKNVPQDAVDIIEWWRRIRELYMTDEPPPEPRWHDSLAKLGAERLKQLGAKYGAEYVIMERTDEPLKLDAVYRNRAYVIYRLR